MYMQIQIDQQTITSQRCVPYASSLHLTALLSIIFHSHSDIILDISG